MDRNLPEIERALRQQLETMQAAIAGLRTRVVGGAIRTLYRASIDLNLIAPAGAVGPEVNLGSINCLPGRWTVQAAVTLEAAEAFGCELIVRFSELDSASPLVLDATSSTPRPAARATAPLFLGATATPVVIGWVAVDPAAYPEGFTTSLTLRCVTASTDWPTTTDVRLVMRPS